ncbi:flavin monoamine oxidase family protein [Clostridium nigeriense]|uniref:flavin monoamine oxidase family protein n=1 Tax=Clostridium nigeriense TaxID=1805470 RepID=UPI003D35894B
MEDSKNSRNMYPSNSPSDYERYNILERELKKEDRIEDIDNIIKLMSPPKDIRSICTSEQGKKVNIAIIGAGEAGLAAAYELKKIGCNITILEASKRIGGRVYTYSFDRLNYCYGEFGEMSIPVSHYTTWHYINLLNLKTNSYINRNQYYYLRNAGAYNKENQVIRNIYPRYDLTKLDKMKLKSKEHLTLFNKYLKSIGVEERQELVQIKDKYSKGIVDLDALSLKKAYEIAGFSEEAINLIGYINGTKELYDYSFIETLQKYYTLDMTNNYSIEGGMIKLPQALYEAIREENLKSYNNINRDDLGKVNIKLGFSVEEIHSSNNKIKLDYINLENKLEGSEEFDYIILTTPFNCLKRMNIKDNFSRDKLRIIDEMNFNNSQKVYLYLKERFWERGRKNERIIGGRTITDLPLYSIYYPSDNGKILYDNNGEEVIEAKGNQKGTGVLLASYSSGNKANEFSYIDDYIKINDVIKYIEKIHSLPKGYLESILIDYKSLVWSDVQYIWGFSTLFKPGDKILYSYSSIIPEMNKRVFFAGNNATVKHGTQQGELQSGMVAANSIAIEIMEKTKQ